MCRPCRRSGGCYAAVRAPGWPRPPPRIGPRGWKAARPGLLSVRTAADSRVAGRALRSSLSISASAGLGCGIRTSLAACAFAAALRLFLAFQHRSRRPAVHRQTIIFVGLKVPQLGRCLLQAGRQLVQQRFLRGTDFLRLGKAGAQVFEVGLQQRLHPCRHPEVGIGLLTLPVGPGAAFMGLRPAAPRIRRACVPAPRSACCDNRLFSPSALSSPSSAPIRSSLPCKSACTVCCASRWCSSSAILSCAAVKAFAGDIGPELQHRPIAIAQIARDENEAFPPPARPRSQHAAWHLRTIGFRRSAVR